MSRLEQAAVALQCRVVARGARAGERGSQSLEWVGLGAVVAAIMGAAWATAEKSGGVVGQKLIDTVANSLTPSH